MHEQTVKKVGLTMRVSREQAYDEPRDALAWDWYTFLREVVPEVAWQPVPNLAGNVVEYVEANGIDAFVFTGGNDVGSEPRRDETELKLLDYALERSLPVFGVCRGLQLILALFGGKAEIGNADVHVAQEHVVCINQACPLPALCSTKQSVNSYHQQVVLCDVPLSGEIDVFATAEDGTVEGVKIKNRPVTAVMWHPERYRVCRKWDRCLVRQTFGLLDVMEDS